MLQKGESIGGKIVRQQYFKQLKNIIKTLSLSHSLKTFWYLSVAQHASFFKSNSVLFVISYVLISDIVVCIELFLKKKKKKELTISRYCSHSFFFGPLK